MQAEKVPDRAPRPRGARKKKEAHRWVREAKAIGGLVVAAFALVALATYRASAFPLRQDPEVHPTEATEDEDEHAREDLVVDRRLDGRARDR